MQKERVVVTGIGLVTPVGSNLPDFLRAIYEGKSGVRTISHFDTSQCRTKMAAAIEDFDSTGLLSEREKGRLDRATQFAVVAADRALKDAGLTADGRVIDADNIGLVIGSGAGNIHTIEKVHREYFKHQRAETLGIPMGMNHATAAHVSMKFGLRGFALTVSTACSSGATAIGIAFEHIRSGHAHIMIAGGVDAPIAPVHLDTWGALRALSVQNDSPAKAMKPFSKNRDGFVLGEGAVLLVLEELESATSRKRKVYGEVLGFGLSSDASHITCPSAEGQSLAMHRALASSSVAPERIDYVNAHGTATTLNDKIETEAIKRVFGTRNVPISSIKPITGHMIGASGAAEFAAAMLAAGEGLIPPTFNYEEKDPDCDLDYVVDGPRQADLNIVMSNSFAFGGHNAVLVAKRPDGGLHGTHA